MPHPQLLGSKQPQSKQATKLPTIKVWAIAFFTILLYKCWFLFWLLKLAICNFATPRDSEMCSTYFERSNIWLFGVYLSWTHGSSFRVSQTQLKSAILLGEVTKRLKFILGKCAWSIMTKIRIFLDIYIYTYTCILLK